MDRPSFYWGIASYDRVDRQPMLLNLAEMGYQRHEIILATQTPTDFEQYSEKYGEYATILYRPASNVSENKNTILEHLRDHCGNTRVVMCSDKVRAINRMGKDGKLYPITTREEMDAFVKKAFFVTKRLGGSAFGLFPIGNTFYMSHVIHINQWILGCFMGILNPADQMFDTNLPLKEDFGYSLSVISRGGKIVRFSDMCMTATLHTKGGCHAAWNSDKDKVNEDCCAYLMATYPGLVKPHATRRNEVRYTGPKATIQKSIFDI